MKWIEWHGGRGETSRVCVGGIIPKDNIIEIKAGYRLKKAGMKTEVYMSFFLFFVQMDAIRPFHCSRDISIKKS